MEETAKNIHQNVILLFMSFCLKISENPASFSAHEGQHKICWSFYFEGRTKLPVKLDGHQNFDICIIKHQF